MNFKHFEEKDVALYNSLKLADIVDVDFDNAYKSDKTEDYTVFYPKQDYRFLHEAAIIEYKGVLHASWYSNPYTELEGYTPIRESLSYDGGKTWSEPKTVCEDKTGKILYCPPVYYKEENKLYMLVNEMVKADHMHSLDLYLYEEETDSYKLLWKRDIPFKLNTNIFKMNNGKLLIPGRIAPAIDKFPKIPAVMIVDDGNIESEYRLVKIQETEYLPQEVIYLHPEISPIIKDNKIMMFSRNDNNKTPIVYLSEDYGEHWSEPMTHNIPFTHSKIFSGTLSNGRNYLLGNLYLDRRQLILFLTEPDSEVFTKAVMLRDGREEDAVFRSGHYPAACEWNEKLYVIYSTDIKDVGRGALLSVVPIDV